MTIHSITTKEEVKIHPYIFAGLPKESIGLTIKIIEMVACKHMYVTPNQLRKKTGEGKITRLQELVLTRQIVYYFAKKYLPSAFKYKGLLDTSRRFTLKGVGHYYKQDHATVVYGIRTIDSLINFDKDMARKVKEIEIDLLKYNILK